MRHKASSAEDFLFSSDGRRWHVLYTTRVCNGGQTDDGDTSRGPGGQDGQGGRIRGVFWVDGGQEEVVEGKNSKGVGDFAGKGLRLPELVGGTGKSDGEKNDMKVKAVPDEEGKVEHRMTGPAS